MLLQEVVFDSCNQDSQMLSDPIDVNTFIDANKIKHQFEIEYIQGAEEVEL